MSPTQSRSTSCDDRRAWLRSAPTATSSDALAAVAAIGARVATAQSCPTAHALADACPPSDRVAAWVAGAPEDALDPGLLGDVWEAMLDRSTRRRQGSHFTPGRVADAVAEAAVDRVDDRGSCPTVLDPAVGGGAFLLAVARALVRRGFEPADIVGNLHGIDIDPGAVAVADAALELWSHGAARPAVTCADALGIVDPASGESDEVYRIGFDLVIGNPPFLGQLTADTARSHQRREELIERFDLRAVGYADEAGLFLLAGIERVRAGGVVSMIVPQSLLGAADAAPIRSALASSADLAALWIGPPGSFDAAVDVVAPLLIRGTTTATTTIVGPDAPAKPIETPGHGSWAPLLASAAGVPEVDLRRATRSRDDTIGGLAVVTAGFRQHFYGLGSSVRERAGDADSAPKLVTSGAIDPLNLRWGERVTRFARTRWERPVIDVDEIEDDAVRLWFSQRLRPKILVASQTRIVEVVVDEAGRLLPSVPVISVEPHDVADLWPLAAYLTSPKVSAHLAGLASGTGMSRGSLRLRAASLAELPVERHGAHRDVAGDLARSAQASAAVGDRAEYERSILELVRSFAARCGEDARALEWWCDRRQFPHGSARGHTWSGRRGR